MAGSAKKRAWNSRKNAPRYAGGFARERAFDRPLRYESLEDRCLLSLGDLLHTLADPSTLPQANSQFGYAVAVDGPYTVVGTHDAASSGYYSAGRAYVFDTSTGALVATLNNPSPADYDHFGYSVAVSGNMVVVGAYWDDTGTIDTGSAYVFDAATGNLLWTLNNPNPAAYDYFGSSVAIFANTVVVGAYGDDTGATDTGSAYVFDAATGNLLWTLNNPTPTSDDRFGNSVAVSGTTVVVGAYYDDTGATDSGSAYVFDAATGNLLWTLNNPTPTAFDCFGCSVAILGSTIVVGAYYDDAGATRAGSAYVFDAATGNLLRTLNNPRPTSRDYFGCSVAVSGSTVVVGAYGDDTGAFDAGSTYAFDAATGNLLWTLNNPTPAASEFFGYSVANSDSMVVVGAYRDDTGATDAGAAYLFDTATGNLLRTLNNPTPAASDYFGYSVAVSGSTVVVGTYRDDTDATDAGSAYMFDAATGDLLWTFNNPTPTAGDSFGYSVAVSGSMVVVGARGDNTGATDAGSAYVFDAATGNLLWTLNNPTPAASDFFGYSVAVSGNTVVVGAYYDDTGKTDAGSAYVFDAATGNLLRTLNNPTPYDSDYFGYSVAVSGSTVVVGAYHDDTGTTDAGSAYLFDAATGNLLWTLNNPNPASSDCFGNSVAVSGSTVIVGAYGDETGATNAGSAHLFDATTGGLLCTLNNPTPAAVAYFGCSVAVSGGTVVVGAYGVDGGTANRGAAYLFDVSRAPTDIVISAANITENRLAGTVVGTFSTTDPNLPDDAHVYTLAAGTGDTDNASFTIVGSQLRTAASFDYETKNSYTVRVRATDQEGLWFEKNFTINVIDVNEGPTEPTLSATSIDENRPTGTTVGTLATTNPDNNITFSYTLAIGTSSDDNASFTIVGNQVQTAASFDYETKNSYTIRVRATDQQGFWFEKNFTITVTNVNEAPTAIGLSAASIDEHRPFGVLVGAFSATDPDAASSFSYTLVSGPGSEGNAAFSIDSSGRLVAAKTFNYEVQNSYSIRVRATDQGGLWFEKTFTIAINDVPETLGTLLASMTDRHTNPQAGSQFGYAVAVDGPYTVVGSPYAASSGYAEVGRAHVYHTSTGALVAALNNPTPAGSDYFGISVAISGSTVVVGASGNDTGVIDEGSAYLFDAATGNLLRTLKNPNPYFNDYFGRSVAISGNTVVVGADGDNTGADGAGSVYVFDAATGNLLRTLTNPTPSFSDAFGNSVAISGSTVVVGAYRDDTGANNAGSAYLFDAATGGLLWTLNNPTPATGDSFGCSVAVSGNKVVVGAFLDDTGADYPGSAYVFDVVTGNFLRTLKNPTPYFNDYFGGSVAISGSTVVVGAQCDDTGATNAGLAYVFDVATGSLLRTLNNPTPAASDYFGYSVAVSGSTVVVGANRDDTGAADAGSAYVFDAATGNLVWPLNNPTPATSDYFGYSVAVSSSTVVVGAYYDDTGATDAGSAYVFDAATGNLLWTLNKPTPATSDCFGRSVAVSGSTIIVGALYDDTGANNAGSAYVFDAATGNLLWTLNNPTPATSDWFGCSVAVSGNTVVVGAYYDDTGATDAGSAYVFDAATGNLLWTLNNPTPAAGDYFGYSVAVSGNTVVVGAYYDDTGATDAGSAYVFDAATGNLLWTLNKPTPATSDYFGRSVAVSGSTIIVGALYDDTGATDAGSAYLFDAATGNLLRTLDNPTPFASDYFGSSVAISGSTVVVGAAYDDTGAKNSGSAYVFDAATGVHLHTLNNPTPARDNYFGDSVAVSGSTVVVGAYGVDGDSMDRGAAYVFDVSRAPTDVFLSAANIAENQPADTVVGTFSTTDPNLPDDTHSYTLATGTGDTDNASFTIVGNQLRTAATFDYEAKNSYSIRVRTTDAGGLSHEESFVITVTDVPLRVVGTSPILDQGPHLPLSSIDVTFSDLVDLATFTPNDVGILHLGNVTPTLLGSFGGEFFSSVTVGSILYATTNAGLQILDISNPARVARLGGYATSRAYSEVQVVGYRAYIADSNAGLQILDISNPASVVRLGEYTISDYPMDVQVVGNLAYVVYFAAGLQILDISNPANISLLGGYDTSGYAWGVQVVGNLAYIANYDAGLQILDISNPASVSRIGGYDTSGAARRVQVVGNLAYVAAGDAGLQVLDISNPASIAWLGGYDTTGTAWDVEVVDNLAYIADYGGLKILDIGDPASISQLNVYGNGGYFLGVEVVGNRAYANSTSGLEILDISNPASAFRIGGYDTKSYFRSVQAIGNRAYVANDILGLRILDISNPANASPLGDYNTSGNAYCVQVVGNLAYVADGSAGLQILDISDPTSVTRLGGYDTLGSAYAVNVVGNRAYIADYDDGLQILDISNPASVQRLGEYNTTGFAWDVQVLGNLAYVADWSAGLQILDVSDPTSVTRLGGYDTSSDAYAVSVVGNRAFVADYSAGLQILDIGNPANVRRLGEYNTSGYAWDVQVVGSLAYIADGYSGLQILDIRNPASIIRLGRYDTPDDAHSVQVVGNLAYVADNRSGLQIIQLAPSVSSISCVSGTTYRITLSQPVQGGTFALQLGPEIRDVGGIALDQDNDGTPGETSEDMYTTQFTVYGPPTSIVLSVGSVPEGSSVDTAVGDFSTTDPDVGDKFTYSLAIGTGDTDNASFTIVGNQLRTAASFDYETKNSYSIRVRSTDQQGLWFEKNFTITVINVAPTLAGAFVRGSTWNGAMLQAMADGAAGDTTLGFRLVDGTSQLANSSTIVLSKPDQLTLRFNEAVNVTQSSLVLYNSQNQVIASTGFNKLDARTAQWTFAPLAANKYWFQIVAANTTDAGGLMLDGEWTTSSTTYAASGNGQPGGDLNFRFNVLAGDANGDGTVNVSDVLYLRPRLGAPLGATNWKTDLNASGGINTSDVISLRGWLGVSLGNFAEPTLPVPGGASLMGLALESETTPVPTDSASTVESNAVVVVATPTIAAPSPMLATAPVTLLAPAAITELVSPTTSITSTATTEPTVTVSPLAFTSVTASTEPDALQVSTLSTELVVAVAPASDLATATEPVQSPMPVAEPMVEGAPPAWRTATEAAFADLAAVYTPISSVDLGWVEPSSIAQSLIPNERRPYPTLLLARKSV